MLIAGKTRAGKSKLMEGLIKRYIEQYDGTILILDAKNPPDYQRFDGTILPYFEEMMDPIKLKSLVRGENISLAELDRLIDVSESWEEIVETAKTREQHKKTHPVTKDRLRVISILFGNLIKEMEDFEFSDEIVLSNKINVMNISEMTEELQQVVVASVVSYVHRNLSNVVVVMDEAHRFIPQRASSACAPDVTRFVREGAALSNYLWISDQTVTGISKEVLKQVDTWILGRQREINEAKRVVEQVPQRKSMDLKPEDIQTLRVGEFLVVSENWAKTTYAMPIWIDEKTAREVAIGERKIKEVKDLEPKEDDDDLTWKPKYEKERRKAQELRKEVSNLKKDKEAFEGTKFHELETELKEKIATLEAENTELKEFESSVDDGKITEIEIERDKWKDLHDNGSEIIRDLRKEKKQITEKHDNFLIDYQEVIDSAMVLRDGFIRFLDIKGSSMNASGESTDINSIVAEVIAKIGTSGVTYEVAPLVLLKKEWEKNIVNSVTKTIDSLNAKQLKILSYIVSSGPERRGEMCKVLFGVDSGNEYTEFKTALDSLIEKGLVYTKGRQIHNRLFKLMEDLLQNHEDADLQNITHHIIEHLRGKH